MEAGDPQVAADAQLRGPDGYRRAFSHLTGDFLRRVERARGGLRRLLIRWRRRLWRCWRLRCGGGRNRVGLSLARGGGRHEKAE